MHPDRVRGQPAVHDPVPVRVRHRLGDLPQQPQLRFRGNAARVVGLPQVEPLEPVIDRVHQADAELAVDDVPRAQQPVVRQPRHDPELVLGDLADLGPFGRGRARRGDQEPDPAPVGGGHPVEGRPVLPAVTLAERLLVDHPRARFPLAPLDDPDPLHQRGDDLIAVSGHGLLRRGRLEQPPGDPGQPGIALGAIQAEQVHPGRLRQQAAQARVMQEDGLLHERHDRTRVGDRRARLLGKADQLVPQLAGQPLGLAPRQLQRGVLGPVTIAPPGQVIPAQGARVVLQLHQVQATPAQHQQVDLVPLAMAVAELEVRPRAEGRVRGQQGPDEVQPLRLVGELGRGYLNPALNALRHGPLSSTCPQAYPPPGGPPKSSSCQDSSPIGQRMRSAEPRLLN